ncbi:uncharacterized protein LOC132600014 isoform X1 [Lycium barbarum]|uniref:uncharacterized protein LOC132600014 isoform X1 n=1 Tax=Lycium barbarum TaxID=112863 RepID=UPI00293EBD61|nr:uncharacterized protein LOC132600014 isoform X1 [Lycium barbarum]
MPVNVSEQQSKNTMDAAVLPDKGVIVPRCESYIDLPSLSSPSYVKIPISMDTQSSSQNHANLKNDSTDVYSPYILDIDIEKGKPEALKSIEEMGGNLKTEDSLTMMLQREITSQMAGKLIHFLNHNFELPNFTFKDKWVDDKICDTSSNRLRKYKRAASFNSRRVVLLFSVLSSVGTIILIYLTLRVRMIADGSGNV